MAKGLASSVISAGFLFNLASNSRRVRSPSADRGSCRIPGCCTIRDDALGRYQQRPEAASSAADGLSHSAASIRQQIDLSATPSRVYEALTNTKQFEAITRLSDAATLLDAANAQQTPISNEAGGAFTLFGGYVIGRKLQMLPAQRLVQAWHAGS